MAKGRDNIYIDNNSLSEESIDEDDLYDGGKNPKTRSKGIDRRKKDKGKGKANDVSVQSYCMRIQRCQNSIFDNLCSKDTHGRRLTLGPGTPYKKMKLVVCRALLMIYSLGADENGNVDSLRMFEQGHLMSCIVDF